MRTAESVVLVVAIAAVTLRLLSDEDCEVCRLYDVCRSKRVDGIELGLQGNITPRWTAYSGFSALKSTQTKGINKGAEAKNVPDLTANLWTTYAFTDALSLSYGEQYVGRRRYTDNKYVGGLNNNSSYASGASGVRPTRGG